MRFFYLMVGLILFLGGCAGTSSDSNLMAGNRPAHHLPNGHFINTDTSCLPIRDTMELDSLVPTHRTKVYRLPIARGNEELWTDLSTSTATWIGHGTYYIMWKGYGILADPIFSDRASPVQLFGPKRGTPPGRALDSLPVVNLVIISHDHYDHLDKGSIKKIYKKWPQTTFAVPLRVAEILEDWGIPSKNIIELDWWQSATAGPLKLTFVPCHHLSRRGAFKSSENSTLWGSWILERPLDTANDVSVEQSTDSSSTEHAAPRTQKIWFAGDLAMGDGTYYKEIAEKFGPVDVAFLPIGSYKPSRYTRVHVSPRQAAQLHLIMGSRQSLAMHWGDFGMVYDRLEDPPKDLARARQELSIPDSSFTVPQHGEIVPIFK